MSFWALSINKWENACLALVSKIIFLDGELERKVSFLSLIETRCSPMFKWNYTTLEWEKFGETEKVETTSQRFFYDVQFWLLGKAPNRIHNWKLVHNNWHFLNGKSFIGFLSNMQWRIAMQTPSKVCHSFSVACFEDVAIVCSKQNKKRKFRVRCERQMKWPFTNQ